MIRRVGFGIILWVIPYALAIPLLPLAKTQPMIFKSLVVSIAAITSALLTVFYFKNVEKDFLRESIILACTWIIVNWLLDVIALLPFTHESLPQYFLDLGIEYIALSSPVIALGYLLDKKSHR